MPTTPVTLLPGTLPYDCYPALPQTLNVDIVTRIQAFLSEAFPGIYKGPTAPPVDQRDRLWYNTTSDKWYQYVNGDWMRRYEVPPRPTAADPGPEWIWDKTEGELNTYAGGDANPVGALSGPLWEIDHELDGRVMVGAGAVPGSDPAATIAQGAIADSNGREGAYQVALTEAEGAVGDHIHPLGLTNQDGASSSDDAYFNRSGLQTVPGYSGFYITGSATKITTGLTTADLFTLPSGATGAGVTAAAHNNMPQFRARYVIRRTARIWVSSPF